MFQILFKIWYFIVVFPILIIGKGYDMLKKTIAKYGLAPDWAWAWLVILIIFLILVILFKYGYH